ncbi:MAG TPA: response regulator [Usitatibacter sp.]|nr:response regulator [Usitatibacter sp.]
MPTEDFRRIFETLRVAIAGADAAGAIAFANAAFSELASQADGPLPGKPLGDLFVADDRRRVLQNVARVGEGKAASAFVDARLAGEAEGRWVSVGFQPWLDSRDQPSGVLVVLQEIGAQRDTEAALNLAAARLLALAEASPAAKMVETEAGEVELANEAFCRLLSLDSAPQSLPGLAVEEILARSPLVDAREAKRARRSGSTMGSIELRLDDGRMVTLERRPVLVDERVAGAVWTSREEAAGGRAPAKGEAEVALIEKIAQELSVALEGLSTLSIRAQSSDFDPVLVEHYQRIRGATETAMAAIGDLVDFSRMSGGVVLHRRPFALRAALASLVERIIPAVEERGSRLRLKIEQDVSDCLEGDIDRLLMILKNLLDNALAIAPGGEVTLQITPEYLTESGIQLSFSVLVAGTAAAAPKASPEGGMGVAVAKFMVAAMGGKLAIAARAGAEALYGFTIEFPVRPAVPQPPRPSFATLVGMPVLLVSGDCAQRDEVANLLRGWRMLPLEADNAPMALALLDRLHQEGTPIPLVILSNRLPVQDGFLLAFRIRHHPRFAPTLVMMLATQGRPGDAIACRENGIAAYMRYPIRDNQLNEAIMAVTGASVDVAEAPTLVTRHSLREQRKGATVLLVDRSRDSQILAAHILGREDCSVVVAHDLAEALGALDQDTYDVLLVDTSLAGLEGDDAAAKLRARIARNPHATKIVAVSLEHSPAYREGKLAAGFDATVAKPFRKDDLLQLLRNTARPQAAPR